MASPRASLRHFVSVREALGARRKREGGADANWHPPLPAFCHVPLYARLATDERHTGCVGIVAIGVRCADSSSRDACG